MTAKLKMFHGGSLFLPSPWLEALGLARHVRQCNLFVIAWTKSDVAAMLTDRGIDQRYADMLAGATRLMRQVAATPLVLLVEAGAIDTTSPGVYAYRDFVKDGAVIRVEPDGSCSVAAHFRQPQRNAPLIAEKTEACPVCLGTGIVECVDAGGESAYETACPEPVHDGQPSPFGTPGDSGEDPF